MEPNIEPVEEKIEYSDGSEKNVEFNPIPKEVEPTQEESEEIASDSDEQELSA